MTAIRIASITCCVACICDIAWIQETVFRVRPARCTCNVRTRRRCSRVVTAKVVGRLAAPCTSAFEGRNGVSGLGARVEI